MFSTALTIPASHSLLTRLIQALSAMAGRSRDRRDQRHQADAAVIMGA